MSNPRYVPRSFAVSPRLFGDRETIEWRVPDEAWTVRERAHLSASELQHQIAYGLQEIYMPSSPTPKITELAKALDVPYDRFQKMLTGYVVMQLEDIGMLRNLVGPRLDFWMLRGPNGEFVRSLEREAKRRKEAAEAAGQQSARPSSGSGATASNLYRPFTQSPPR